jgi:solute carrier family 12 sodium/potassium/chloride transporter 2
MLQEVKSRELAPELQHGQPRSAAAHGADADQKLENQMEKARHYLNDLMVLARMPKGYEIIVERENFVEFVEKAPHADLNIFGLGKSVNKKTMEKLVDQCESTCLFVRDSGHESVLV